MNRFTCHYCWEGFSIPKNLFKLNRGGLGSAFILPEFNQISRIQSFLQVILKVTVLHTERVYMGIMYMILYVY